MLDDLISAYGDRFLVAALGVSLALLCLFIVLWILRNRAPSPFVRGGRNRQPRLQVLDAAAIDTRRRIVLIRRDNIEHLVMIGGPTDLVIESGIGDERPYLSARPVNQDALEEQQQELPKPVAAPALAVTESSSPLNAPSVSEARIPMEAPASRPSASEASKAEPLRPQPTPAAQTTEQRRPQPVPPRPTEAAPERSAAPLATPVMAATIAAAPAAMASTTSAPAAQAAAPDKAPAIEPFQSPTQPTEPSREAEPKFAPPPVNLAAVMAVEPPIRPDTPAPYAATVSPERDATPITPAVSPEVTAGSPPIESFRSEPVEPVMTREKQQSAGEEAPPFAGSQTSTAAPTVAIDPPSAEDVLEAARLRVLAPAEPALQPRTFDAQRLEPASESRPTAPEPEAPARDLSDFERVLEEEMALHIAADPRPGLRPTSMGQQILPETRADRPRLPVSAILPEPGQAAGAPPAPPQAAQEPNLQTEIARIFGEMSASRNP